MSFKVGDLVEVVDGPDFTSPWCRQYIGHVGKIHSPGLRTPSYWRVEGTLGLNGDLCSFAPQHLRLKRPPTDDKQEPRADFTPGEWDLIPWKPTQVKA